MSEDKKVTVFHLPHGSYKCKQTSRASFLASSQFIWEWLTVFISCFFSLSNSLQLAVWFISLHVQGDWETVFSCYKNVFSLPERETHNDGQSKHRGGIAKQMTSDENALRQRCMGKIEGKKASPALVNDDDNIIIVKNFVIVHSSGVRHFATSPVR